MALVKQKGASSTDKAIFMISSSSIGGVGITLVKYSNPKLPSLKGVTYSFVGPEISSLHGVKNTLQKGLWRKQAKDKPFRWQVNAFDPATNPVHRELQEKLFILAEVSREEDLAMSSDKVA